VAASKRWQPITDNRSRTFRWWPASGRTPAASRIIP